MSSSVRVNRTEIVAAPALSAGFPSGGAAEWVSSSADPCEPYAIDIEVEHVPPCGGAEKEITLFPEFRADSKEVDFGEAAVSVSGRCNATEPIVTRVAQ